MILDAGIKMAKDLLYPVCEEMDRRQPVMENGRVKVHPSVRSLMRAFGEGGWIAARFDEKFDGEQLPHMISDCYQFVFCAANYAAAAYAGLTSQGGPPDHLLRKSRADRNLRAAYAQRQMAGHHGLDRTPGRQQPGPIFTTTAVPTDKGFYHISGQKIFISAGDHDGVDNIVHLMLAKIEGAPAGVKGISLFIVPRKRPTGDGGLEENDVTVTQIYHKMGYRGTPITELSMGDKDDCRGYLVDRPTTGWPTCSR